MQAVTISAMELRGSIGDILNRVQYTNERFVIERKGTPIAVMIRVDEIERLERLEQARDAELFRMAKTLAERDGLQAFSVLLDQHATLHGERLDLPDNV